MRSALYVLDVSEKARAALESREAPPQRAVRVEEAMKVWTGAGEGVLAVRECMPLSFLRLLGVPVVRTRVLVVVQPGGARSFAVRMPSR